MANDVLFTIYGDAHDRWGRRYSMQWPDLAARLCDHREGAKDGSAISPGLTDGVRGRDHITHRTLVALDVEADKSTGQVPPSPQTLALYIKTLRIAAVVWTTWSHSEEDPRYRVIIPLDKPIDLGAAPQGVDRMCAAVAAANLRLNGVVDQGKLGSSSIFFLARHRAGHPFWSTVIEGTMQNSGELLAVSIMAAEGAAMKAAQLEALRATTQFPPELRALMDAYNDGHDLEQMFVKYGYRRHGDRWKSRYQQPASAAATCILPDHLRWVSFSESDIAAGVGQESASAECAFGDAFQLFVHYEHRGNFRAALRAIGGNDASA